MSVRQFRFGTVAALAPTAEAWATTARRAESLGYATLLVPDTLGTLSVFPAVTAAAAATRDLRVGTFVLNTPVHAPAHVAQHTATVDMLSGGRFELGLGAGRLGGGQQEAERLGVPFGTPGERIDRLAETIRTVKETLGKQADASAPGGGGGGGLRPVQEPWPPILVAGSGRRLLALAAREADIVGVGLYPTATEFDLAAKIGELRDLAGERFDKLELSLNLAGVGDELPAWMSTQLGADPRELAAKGSIALLSGTPTEMADTLLRRRDALGISYLSVNSMFMEQFAPVIERLTGR